MDIRSGSASTNVASPTMPSTVTVTETVMRVSQVMDTAAASGTMTLNYVANNTVPPEASTAIAILCFILVTSLFAFIACKTCSRDALSLGLRLRFKVRTKKSKRKTKANSHPDSWEPTEILYPALASVEEAHRPINRRHWTLPRWYQRLRHKEVHPSSIALTDWYQERGLAQLDFNAEALEEEFGRTRQTYL
ncbi:hypothetical protein BZG36_03896 [Bifiguratus adelaidae]|uniref:Uncharacterized protein n=1 Tax=Bifiguratus adelaidae TaxID=1938954 RepID=A0A261XXQ7_9FUNG|nr:hypothetical protein BZG36_03896 [Bifiguratus adelaidae]